MRRLELLVNEIRDNTDTNDINSIKTYEIMRYFNDAQKMIQKIIYASNQSASIFVKSASYDVAGSSTVAFTLPSDIYAHNSINSVHSLKDNKIAQTLSRVAYRERESLWGYALLDNQIILTTPPEVSTISALLVNYVYRLPTISYRLGKVASVATQVVTIDPSSLIDDTGFQDRYDKYSIVDANGDIIACELNLDSFSGSDFTFTGDLTDVAADQYIVCGDFGTSHSKLPPSCEPLLMAYVQRRILNKIKSNEVNAEQIFTQEERADIEDLFRDNVKDALYPVSSDTNYLGY
jgi:hypothetical protein